MTPPRNATTPEHYQALHVFEQRVPLGTADHVPFRGNPGPDGTGVYWFYVPTNYPGALVITIAGGATSRMKLTRNGEEVTQREANTIVFDLPDTSDGFYQLEMRPVRPVRVRFMIEGWPKEADGSPLIPWNFWYFPFRSGAVKEPSFHSESVQRTAMAKHDRAFLPDSMGATLRWEEQNHIKSDAASWEGHCGMASYASVYFQQPVPRTIRGVSFTRDELELLASEWAGRRHPKRASGDYELEQGAKATVNGKNVVWFMKPSDVPDADTIVERYLEAFPDTTPTEARRVRADADALGMGAVRQDFGAAAWRLLEHLITAIKVQGHVVLGDFGPTKPERAGAETWWSAAFFFSAELREWQTPSGAEDPRLCEIVLSVLTNVDTRPPEAVPLPARVEMNRPVPSAQHQAFEYRLLARFEESGRVRAMCWLEARSPDGLVFATHTLLNVEHPRAPSGPNGNPFVGDGLLQEGLLTLRPRFQRP